MLQLHHFNPKPEMMRSVHSEDIRPYPKCNADTATKDKQVKSAVLRDSAALKSLLLLIYRMFLILIQPVA